MDSIVLILILIGAFALLVSQVVRIEIVSLGLLAVLALSGILNTSEILAGFSSTATITVAAMLILSAGLTRSGVVDYLTVSLEKLSGGGRLRSLVGLGLISSLFSAFLNNTAIVAILIPVALTLSRGGGFPASKLLIPVSYFAILGGTCTLIGTSTNILVDTLYRASGGPGFAMFEFAGMGSAYLLVGSVYILLLGGRLPDRASFSQLVSPQQRSTYVTEITIPTDSSRVGKTIQAAISGQNEIRVLELIRAEEATLKPDPGICIEGGDTYLVEASARAINNLIDREGVEYGTVVADENRVKIGGIDLVISEAVITPNSQYIGQKIRNLGLRRRFGVFVLAMRRMGSGHHKYNLREFVLRSGDVLLLQGGRNSLSQLSESRDALLIEGIESTLTFPRKAPVAVAILGGVVLLATFGFAPMVVLGLAGVALMLMTRCLNITEATRALDSSVLLLLAALIPLGIAMQKTGLATYFAQLTVESAGAYGPFVLVSGFYLLTSILTESLSNSATVVLLVPVALSVASQLSLDPKALLMAITFGASASFATPIGYQTNTLVMGPGGYHFIDFVKFGVPLNLLLWMLASLLIPVFWPI